MAKIRQVHIVMAYNATTKSTYISEVCSNKKKAEEFKEYISGVMRKHDTDNTYIHFVITQRVN